MKRNIKDKDLLEFIRIYHIKFQGEYLILYKVVTRDYGSWWVENNCFPDYGETAFRKLEKNKLKPYLPGRIVETQNCNGSRYRDCGEGLHVGTFAFAKQFADELAGEDNRIMQVLVHPDDVVCVPYGKDYETILSKIRCKKLKVVKQVGGKRQ